MDAGVVGQHEAADLVRSLHVRTFLAKRDLDRRWPPIYEVSQLFLPDSLQRLVDLCGIDFSLDDVEYGHVLSLFGGRADHDVVGMQQPPHHIQDCGLLDVGGLFLYGKRSVSGHEEMASRGRD